MSTPHTYGRQQEKGRRHLLDLNAPRPATNLEAEDRSLTNVQRWVASSIAVTTLLHMALAAIYAAMTVADDRLDAQVGLSAIAGAFGVMAVGAGLAIHGRRVLSPWLALGIIPMLVGLWLALG